MDHSDPTTWLPLLRKRIDRLAAGLDRDEVESEAAWILWRTDHRVRNLVGFVATVVRTALHRVRRRRSVRERACDSDLDRLEAGDSHPGVMVELRDLHEAKFVDLTALLASLRGSQQRWLVERTLAGWTAKQMAEAAGSPVWEIQRRILSLAARLQLQVTCGNRRRRRKRKSAAESPVAGL